MTFIELAKARYSVRKYLDKQIESDKLDLIFKAAEVAPTAANRQPVRFYLLKSEEARSKIQEVTKYTFKAPLWILVAYDSDVSWKNKYSDEDKGEIDCAIVITHMMLQATELGLGTCWIGAFDIEKAKDVFNLPVNVIPTAMFPLGYPDPEMAPSPMHEKRNDVNTVIKEI